MKENNIINEGGINGTGKGVLNTNSQDFITLRQKIVEAAEKRNPIDRMEDQLLGIRFRMESSMKKEDETIGAGTFLRECIQVLKVKNKQFAAYIDYEESNLSAICHGRRKITPELAMKFFKITGIPAELWLGIQNKEELALLNETKQMGFNHMNLRDLIKKSA